MTYSVVEKRRLVHAFVNAKHRLWDGKNSNDLETKKEFICHALNSELARQLIEKRLNGRTTVYSYLFIDIKIPMHKLTNQAVQAFRLAWLNELIKEFS